MRGRLGRWQPRGSTVLLEFTKSTKSNPWKGAQRLPGCRGGDHYAVVLEPKKKGNERLHTT